MLSEQLLDQAARALWLAIVCSALPLGAALVCGFVVSVFQAATQIQEQTLSFVPKLAAVGIILWLGTPALSEMFQEFLAQTYSELVHLHVAAG